MLGTPRLRTPIAESWHRSRLAGLDPATAVLSISQGPIDVGGPLLSAADPVLADLTARLDGTMFSTILVDREGRVARRWSGDDAGERALDDLHVDVGASMLERTLGTNALGTVLETRTSISIHGPEHFAEALRGFSCYGHPIFHPATRRIEGVLDVTAAAESASPLLPPLVARAVADIEQRLLDGSRVRDKELLAAFQAAAVRRRAVVAVGQDLVMSNRAALDLLGSTDVALLRMLAAEALDDSSVDLTLESGQAVRVRVARVGHRHGGALLHLEPREPDQVVGTPRSGPPATGPVAPAGMPPAAARSAEVRAPGAGAAHAPLLVSGPPGSGRTTYARGVAGEGPVTVLTAASALLDGSAAWGRDLGALVRAGQGVVCVDGLDLLPDDLVDLVGSLLDRGAPRLVLVTGPLETMSGRAAAVAAGCTERTVLPPLTQRLAELPEIVATMLRALEAPASLHLTPGALTTLSAQPWPGNLRELRAVVEHVARVRSSGAIVVDDLPPAYRTSAPARPLAPIDRAERDAIVTALREQQGNKVRAARALGISRTTLYAKMRALRITTY